MLTSIRIQNFKRFDDTGDIPLDQTVVFVGPNNSGKTTALQALSLWQLGVNKWLDKRGPKSKASEKTGVALNRKDLLTIPTPSARLLWYNLLTKGKKSEKVLISITVKGIKQGISWACGMDFDYFGEEVLYCRPTRLDDNAILTQNLHLLRDIRVAYLPPMSGLIAQEPKILPSAVNARIGEGRTAEVLRNLCYFILHPESPAQVNGNGAHPLNAQQIGQQAAENWANYHQQINTFFGANLEEPFLNERGELELYYRDKYKNRLEITASGRGLQQVMLLMAYLYANPGAIILLDEPDAHLEILRQRQTYNLIETVAKQHGSQIIVASHSEVILREAAGKDTVIAFTGKPHRINDKGAQLMKSLTTIGFEQYYLAEMKRWVLYVEGATDLKMLQNFARKLNHPVAAHLENSFVDYVATNVPSRAREHFHGLKEAIPTLRGIAIFDRIENPLNASGALVELMWSRRELENYFFQPEVLIAYAEREGNTDDLSHEQRRAAMQEAIRQIVRPIALQDRGNNYWTDIKASDELEQILRQYQQLLGQPGDSSKARFYEMIDWMKPAQIAIEITEKLDAILAVAKAVQ